MTEKMRRYHLKPGSKLEKLFDWLRNEMVGGEIAFSGSHAQRVMDELKVRNQQVWNMLQQLDKKKLITRKKAKGEKGFTISLVPRDAAKSEEVKPVRSKRNRTGQRKPLPSEQNNPATAIAVELPLTVDQLVAKLSEEVERMVKEKEHLENQIRAKNAMIDQIKQFAVAATNRG